MATPTEAYYEYYRRQHRILGAYLAIHCWHAGYDAVIVDRVTLAHMHEITNFTKSHLSRLRDDIRAYFPHTIELFYTNGAKFAAAAFSRIEFPSGFGNAKMQDVPRAEYWRKKDFRVCALSELRTTDLKFTEKEAATFLTQASVGMIIPTPRSAAAPVIRKRIRLRE